MAQQEAPEVGAVIDGYRFKGGNPAQQSSWEAVAPPGARLLPRGRATGDRRSEEAYWGRRRTQGDPAVTQAEQGVAASRRAEGLLARQEAQGQGTGGIYGVPILGTVAGFLDPEIRELNALQARQARLERQPGEGAISDFDAAQFVAMTYGADKPMETNRALIQAQRVINDATLQKREFDEWYFGQYGTTAGSQEAWRVYAQENPIFDPSSQRGEGPARINGERQNWRQYFTGEQGLDTQADIDARSLDGAAALPEFADVRTDQNGLPVYSGPSGSEVSPIPAGADIRRTADGKSYAVVNSENLAPEDTPESLRAAGYQQDADGTWFRMVGSDLPPGDGGGVDGSARPGSGGDARPAAGGGIADLITGRNSADRAVSAREADLGIGRRADTFVRGVADAATFGLSDEITAGLNTIAPLDRGTRGGWNGDWGGAYRQNLDLMRGIDEADAEQMPLTRGAGQLAGAVGGGVGAARMAPQFMRVAPRVSGAGRAANAGRIAANTARLAAGGGAAGAAYGFGSGEGDLGERADDAAMGGVLGAVAGPVAGAVARPVINNVLAPAGRVIARPIAALGERFGVPGAAEASRRLAPNVLEGAVDRYGARFNPDAGVLTQRADELEALGVQPRLINLVDDARAGTFRALNTRDTGAREVASRLPETMRRNLPSRVRQIADEEISNDTRPTLEVIEGLATARRDAAAAGSADFANQTVNLDENVATALRSPLTRSTLGRAAEVMDASLDPAERQAAEYIRQLASGDAGRGAMLSVREVQDITKALNTAARSAFSSENPTAGPTLRSLSGAIRQAGRDQSDDYARFLDRYSDDMGLEEAATTGRNFVQAAPDPISERGTAAFVRNAANAVPPELAVQRAAARQAMEAQGSGPAGARGVLESLASNEDQFRRAAALGADAPRLRARSEAELRVLQDAQRVSPRVGSETMTNAADQAAEIGGAIGDVARGNLPGIMARLGRRFMSRGFNDQQAEAISLAAMDPARTREVIDMLATRMNRQEARSMLRAIRFSAARGAGEYAGDDE